MIQTITYNIVKFNNDTYAVRKTTKLFGCVIKHSFLSKRQGYWWDLSDDKSFYQIGTLQQAQERFDNLTDSGEIVV